MAGRKTIEIPDSKIRIVIWMLEKANKTKKECCEYLGITYNTTRLTKIISDFRDKELREKNLKTKAKTKVFNEAEIKDIIKEYTSGTAISKIAESYYLPFNKIKKVLLDSQVPIRARGKKKSAKVDHIKQNLDIKFNIGEMVFIPGPNPEEYINKNKALVRVKNAYGKVVKVFDEDYLESITDGYMKDYQLPSWNKIKEDMKPRRGVHFETYWYLSNGEVWGKIEAFQHHVKEIEEHLVNYGRELYRVRIKDKSYNGLYYFKRDELFPVPQGENSEI